MVTSAATPMKRNSNATVIAGMRSERQTLRKLPDTGAIVFTIGVYVAPLGSLSPRNIARLAELLTDDVPDGQPREYVDEIQRSGGVAVASHDSVDSPDGGEAIVHNAIPQDGHGRSRATRPAWTDSP